MTGVILIWLLQIIAFVAYAFGGASTGGLRARLKRALTNGMVIGLGLGLVGFIVVGFAAAKQSDYVGAAAASTSFYVQLFLLVITFLGLLFARLAGRSGPDFVFGSARFATLADARAAGLIGETGIRLGKWRYLDRDEAQANGSREEPVIGPAILPGSGF